MYISIVDVAGDLEIEVLIELKIRFISELISLALVFPVSSLRDVLQLTQRFYLTF